MTVTRDVVLDLLPLYAAGEASADTRALVEDFLRQDPELARLAREASQDLLAAPRAPLPPDVELRSLRRTHGVLRWQRITYGWALTLSLLCLSTAFSIEGGHLHVRMLILEDPRLVLPGVVLALTCWVNYALLRRRVRVTKA
ncbi:MAG TPA: hypothetical protein VGQ33_14960 [Vicinamibacteria bacterium]|nr:hypothetical protein [Vicinamibacteria bacterium]